MNNELIADLQSSIVGDPFPLMRKAADAIEALEAERDSLAHHLNRQKQWKDAMRDKMRALQAEVERLEEVWLEDSVRASEDRGDLLKERDALQAQLAAAQGQSPDSYRLYDDVTGASIFYPRVRLPKSIDESWEIRPLFARPLPQQPSVPEGWKLVPIEPTKEMICAPPNAWPADAKVTWAAMLAAAPQPKEPK